MAGQLKTADGRLRQPTSNKRKRALLAHQLLGALEINLLSDLRVFLQQCQLVRPSKLIIIDTNAIKDTTKLLLHPGKPHLGKLRRKTEFHNLVLHSSPPKLRNELFREPRIEITIRFVNADFTLKTILLFEKRRKIGIDLQHAFDRTYADVKISPGRLATGLEDQANSLLGVGAIALSSDNRSPLSSIQIKMHDPELTQFF